MATAIRMSITQRPGMQGVEVTYSLEAIVDDPADAREQGGEVFRLITAFEDGYKEGIPDE